MQDQLPKIRLGAEVRYFEGISHSSAVHDLKIENTDLLLLEMPFVPWSQRMIQEVKAAQQFNLTILLAHVERYRKTQGFSSSKKLEEMGVFDSIQCRIFLNKKTRKKAMHLF